MTKKKNRGVGDAAAKKDQAVPNNQTRNPAQGWREWLPVHPAAEATFCGWTSSGPGA